MKHAPEAAGIYGSTVPRQQVSMPNGLGRSAADAPNMGKRAGTGEVCPYSQPEVLSFIFPGHTNTSRVHLGTIKDACLDFSSVLIGKVFGPEKYFCSPGKVLFFGKLCGFVKECFGHLKKCC